MNPFSKFEEWYKEELFRTQVIIPSACCLSTTGLDGYPNARFVSFKSILEKHFIITGPTSSRKGLELDRNPKAAITFWWTETKRQVRIQGDVLPLEKEIADFYFKERSRDAQLISTIFEQGKQIESPSDLTEVFKQAKKESLEAELKRPQNWGGFKINPIRIEFLVFENNRLHSRELFTKSKDRWNSVFLQP